VIVSDFHIKGIAAFPAETDSPLFVDSDAVSTLSIPRKLLKAIPGGHPEVGQSVGGVKYEEFLQCWAVDILRELFRAFATEDLFGLRVFEAPNHRIMIMRRVNNVKRYVSFSP
jgi:hypothetical protein